MKVRNWLLLTTFLVMLAPFILTYFFVSYLTDWYEREEVSEYIHSSIRINELASEVKSNHRLFFHPRIAEEVLQRQVQQDEIIHLYSKDRQILYSIHETPLFKTKVPTSQLMKGLYETRETKSHFIYKEPVYEKAELIGYFEIKKERVKLKQQIDRSTLYTFFFFIGVVGLTMLITHFLVKRRIVRPLQVMVSEMKAIRDGEIPESCYKHNKKDEFLELIDGFYEMSTALQVAKVKEAETNAMKHRLIAAISHDLRTPLTSIKAYAEGMGDHLEKQEEYRRVIVHKANYMENLINDLLLYSRLEMDEFRLDFQKVDGEELAEMLVDGYEEVHNQKDIRFKVTMKVTPCEIYCDVDRLVQVMDNLVSNAIRYTPERKTVELIATTQESLLPKKMSYQEGYLYFLVRDEGIGIKEEEQKKIFTLFYQVDEARKKEQNKGAGLGLAISKNLVEKHGGLIGVHSSGSQGSIVYFALPMFVQKENHE
ncbi:HAMP domain-containing histidine kinase [bacterium LRH843]|nr:HAMP domain-containing histidine kinase [bacterium LRH843]